MEDLISKVLDLAEVDTFRWDDAIVHFPWPVDLTKVKINWKGPVPVLGAGGVRIGFASLDFDGHAPVLADLFLVKESPERLDLEQKLHPLYLSVHDAARMYRDESETSLYQVIINSLRLSLYSDGIVGPIEAVR